MALSVSTTHYPQAVMSCLDQIATELSQDPNLLRIKKLLLYVCTETWETDRRRLERLSLRSLLEHLLEFFPTFEILQQGMNQAVATLNKSAEYIMVATAVISRFPAVYAELAQGQIITARQEVYWLVVQQVQTLAPAAAQTRIKKLMLLTCRGTWETGSDRLAALSLPDLVRELHQIAPTAESLETTLNQVAQALSKPEEYSQVAAAISLAFQPLYRGDLSGEVTEAMTDLRPAQATPVLAASDLTAADLTAAEATLLPNLTAAQPTRTLLRVLKSPVARHQPLSRKIIAQPPKAVDLFDLRLELMQDSNPYRVKILLFSLLHGLFEGSADQEALLRTHELDELLHILFLSYRRYDELESKLRQTAVALAKDEYMQAAAALLRAVQSYYVIAAPIAVPISAPISAPQVGLTEITNMKVTTHAITLPD